MEEKEIEEKERMQKEIGAILIQLAETVEKLNHAWNNLASVQQRLQNGGAEGGT